MLGSTGSAATNCRFGRIQERGIVQLHAGRNPPRDPVLHPALPAVYRQAQQLRHGGWTAKALDQFRVIHTWNLQTVRKNVKHHVCAGAVARSKISDMKRSDPHPSMVRLLEAAAHCGVMNSSALAAALFQSDGTVGNWASRGVSGPGAMKAQAVFGCSALWVMQGKGAQWLQGGPVQPPPLAAHGDIERDIAALSPTAVELALLFDDLTRDLGRSERAIVNAEAIAAIRTQLAAFRPGHEPAKPHGAPPTAAPPTVGASETPPATRRR